MAFGKPLLSSHVGYITIHEPESHIQFGHVSHFFRQCVILTDPVTSKDLRTASGSIHSIPPPQPGQGPAWRIPEMSVDKCRSA